MSMTDSQQGRTLTIEHDWNWNQQTFCCDPTVGPESLTLFIPTWFGKRGIFTCLPLRGYFVPSQYPHLTKYQLLINQNLVIFILSCELASCLNLCIKTVLKNVSFSLKGLRLSSNQKLPCLWTHSYTPKNSVWYLVYFYSLLVWKSCTCVEEGSTK